MTESADVRVSAAMDAACDGCTLTEHARAEATAGIPEHKQRAATTEHLMCDDCAVDFGQREIRDHLSDVTPH